MNSRERVAAAMGHRPVDRVPVMCQLALGHYFLHGRHRPSDIWFDSEAFVETLVQFQQRYRFDGVLVNLPGRPAEWRTFLHSSERGDAGERLVWRDGAETWVPRDDNAHTLLAGGKPLPRADPSRVDADDPATYRLAGYVWNTWHAPGLFDLSEDADLTRPQGWPEWSLRSLELARRALPEVSVHAEVFSPFTHLVELFGYDRALMALLDVPETCHRLLARFAEQVRAQVSRQAPCRPDAVLISSAFAGAGFISRAMYREFVLPYERAVVQEIRSSGTAAYLHTCGAIGDRLDLMAVSEVDGLDTLDPPPLGTVDLARAKAEYGERFFFKGNLDAVHEMLRADDATFERAVRQRLAIGAPGSGYILSSACSVAPHVDPDRLARLAELAQGD